jgi:hypothetical protein
MRRAHARIAPLAYVSRCNQRVRLPPKAEVGRRGKESHCRKSLAGGKSLIHVLVFLTAKRLFDANQSLSAGACANMQIMSRLATTLAIVAALCVRCPLAEASIVVTVDKSAQRLTVAIDGSPRYRWPVSTARWGYSTPNGSYRPERLARKWFSRKYDWSPMPYSIFFNGGYAIHGSYEITHLGRPASHGCIRLHPQNAAILFALVKEHISETSILVTGEAPSSLGGKWQWQY